MVISLGLRSFFLAVALVHGTLVALLLLARGARRGLAQDFFLAGLLLALAMSLIAYIIGFMGLYDYARDQGRDLTFFPFGNAYLFGPLIWLYVGAVTDRQFRWRAPLGLHFLLPLAYYAVSFSLWALSPAQKTRVENSGLWIADQLLLFFSLGAYLYVSLRRYRQYRRLLDTEYSNTDRLTLNWLRNFLYAFTAYYLLGFGFNLASWWIDFWYTGWFWLELTRGVLLYYLSMTGWAFAQRNVVSFDWLERREAEMAPPAAATDAKTGSPVKTVFSPEELEKRRALLETFMQTRRPWLDPDLTLSQLAGQLNLNVSQLSYLVNAGFGKNFNDFVNAYRVEEVKRIMQDPAAAHLSLLGIAFECGFNSKATFNRAFKKSTGVSPSQFLKPG